jgi:hypothetical protein
MSPARQQKFKEFQEFFQTDIHKILNPAITRWLSLKACVDGILEQFEPLKAYFRVVVLEDPSETTDSNSATMENQHYNLIKNQCESHNFPHTDNKFIC